MIFVKMSFCKIWNSTCFDIIQSESGTIFHGSRELGSPSFKFQGIRSSSDFVTVLTHIFFQQRFLFHSDWYANTFKLTGKLQLYWSLISQGIMAQSNLGNYNINVEAINKIGPVWWEWVGVIILVNSINSSGHELARALIPIGYIHIHLNMPASMSAKKIH